MFSGKRIFDARRSLHFDDVIGLLASVNSKVPSWSVEIFTCGMISSLVKDLAHEINRK